jgi:hypothetical protein
MGGVGIVVRLIISYYDVSVLTGRDEFL